MNEAEIERLATTLASFMAEQNPHWLDTIRRYQSDWSYEQWRESYDKFTADFLPGMKAVGERLASKGIDPEIFLRAMWVESRKLAQARDAGGGKTQ
jgi:hypothetical protein